MIILRRKFTEKMTSAANDDSRNDDRILTQNEGDAEFITVASRKTKKIEKTDIEKKKSWRRYSG